jgi:4-alpha-glucanotransferase
MSKHLDDLAESHGIQTRYISQLGEHIEISDEAKTALLQVLRVDPNDTRLGQFSDMFPADRQSCYLPDEVAGKRLWGVTCQLYGLRSSRNLGIGDFEDLARLGEFLAPLGADFLGVNPLHALFFSDPARTSPYSPSTRQHLNPLYIAIDQIDGGEEAQKQLRASRPELFERNAGDLVDYAAATAIKVELLRSLYRAAASKLGGEFDAFCRAGGESLHSFALFEAISAHEVAAGGGAGWKHWPGDMQRRDSDAVRRFDSEHADDVRFHLWLQFVVDAQLASANERVKKAGMQVGLYLDFAVGVAPDGAETWADPDLAVRDARVGSPPDLLNSEGQDWGLAPLAPQVLVSRDFKPLADAYTALMKNAGAIRIDHAMGLARLWWVPASGKPNQGGFIRYPFGAMLNTVAAASQQTRSLVIGEDLGTVPEGFSEAAQSANLFSYRVVFFEKNQDGVFYAPEVYPKLALATISTHDLATLAGWWQSTDIQLRADTGRQSEDDTRNALEERSRDRLALLTALDEAGLLDEEYRPLLSSKKDLPAKLDEKLFQAIHRFGARSRSILFAVQLDDLLMSETQANLPGTTTEYPNWHIRMPCQLEDLEDNALVTGLLAELRAERPRT